MWLNDAFRVKKPVIAVVHLMARPGDPGLCHSGRHESDYQSGSRPIGGLASRRLGFGDVFQGVQFALPDEEGTHRSGVDGADYR